MKTIGERIRYQREKKNISQVSLAKHIGVSQQAIQQVEIGKARKPRNLYEIAQKLECSYEWLVFGNDKKKYVIF